MEKINVEEAFLVFYLLGQRVSMLGRVELIGIHTSHWMTNENDNVLSHGPQLPFNTGQIQNNLSSFLRDYAKL